MAVVGWCPGSFGGSRVPSSAVSYATMSNYNCMRQPRPHLSPLLLCAPLPDFMEFTFCRDWQATRDGHQPAGHSLGFPWMRRPGSVCQPSEGCIPCEAEGSCGSQQTPSITHAQDPPLSVQARHCSSQSISPQLISVTGNTPRVSHVPPLKHPAGRTTMALNLPLGLHLLTKFHLFLFPKTKPRASHLLDKHH